jgi:hypothetical protein
VLTRGVGRTRNMLILNHKGLAPSRRHDQGWFRWQT